MSIESVYRSTSTLNVILSVIYANVSYSKPINVVNRVMFIASFHQTANSLFQCEIESQEIPFNISILAPRLACSILTLCCP